MLSDLVETNRCNASALRTVRIATELARSHSRLQIRGDRASSLCKNAVIRTRRRIQKPLNDAARHIELRVDFAQLQQFPHHLDTGRFREDLVTCLTDLRCKQAYPNLPDLFALRPEMHKLTKVSWPRRHLARDRAMDGTLVAGDVLQNTIICSRFTALVVLTRQPIDGYDDFEFFELIPFQGDFSHGACNHVRADSPRRESGHDFSQFLEPNVRFGGDYRSL